MGKASKAIEGGRRVRVPALANRLTGGKEDNWLTTRQ